MWVPASQTRAWRPRRRAPPAHEPSLARRRLAAPATRPPLAPRLGRGEARTRSGVGSASSGTTPRRPRRPSAPPPGPPHGRRPPTNAAAGQLTQPPTLCCRRPRTLCERGPAAVWARRPRVRLPRRGALPPPPSRPPSCCLPPQRGASRPGWPPPGRAASGTRPRPARPGPRCRRARAASPLGSPPSSRVPRRLRPRWRRRRCRWRWRGGSERAPRWHRRRPSGAPAPRKPRAAYRSRAPAPLAPRLAAAA
mmetsp:Transcript_28695/g.84713  ORF Transcript_28695/g.84713 Transcript_28695/m.84713 type:complete len:251 (-) Transcript_28695:396-1148(-)